MKTAETIPLDQAAEMVHRLLPDPDQHWRRKIWSPDYVISRARAAGGDITVTFVRDWERRGDDDLTQRLLGDRPFTDPRTLVVTDLCLGSSPPDVEGVDGAFQVDGSRLEEFVQEYRDRYVDHFVDGDVIIASPLDRVIRVFHHEGAVFGIALP